MKRILLFLFLFFTYIPYFNFGLHNALTNKGELTYFYLLIAALAFLFPQKWVVLFKTKEFYILAFPVVIDSCYSIFIGDVKDFLKDISIIIVTAYVISYRFQEKDFVLVRNTILLLLLIHTSFSLLNLVFPIPPWFPFINFGQQRGDVLAYLMATYEMGKFVRGINTEPGTNINILLLLLNLYFLLFFVTRYRKAGYRRLYLVILVLLNSFYFLLIKAVRMAILFIFDYVYLILIGISDMVKRYRVYIFLIFIFSVVGVLLFFSLAKNNPEYNRLESFLTSPIYTIETDPSIHAHIEKLLGEESPSGFSIIFIYGHIGLLIYLGFLLWFITRNLPKDSFLRLCIYNVIIVSVLSFMIASYHSPYNLVSMILIYKLLKLSQKHKGYTEQTYRIDELANR